ncbi:MAG: LptF/LptG family permease [Planctomycetota bacterium]
MPTRLTRYILFEIIKVFAVALFVLTILILLIGVGREFLRQGLSPVAVVQLLPFFLPIAFQHGVPATALFAVCVVYGRMAADGEVATVKASGVSPLRLLQPAFVFAALLSPLAVYISDLSASWGKPGVERVVLLSIEDITYRVLRSDHSYSEDGFSIHVRDVIGDRMIQPTVTIHDRSGSGHTKISAQEGSLRLDEASQSLMLSVLNSQVTIGGKVESKNPGTLDFPIPLSDAFRNKDVSEQSPSDVPLRLISSERISQDNRNHAAIGELAAHTGFSLLTSRDHEIAGSQGAAIEAKLASGKRRLTRLQTEPWRRWAEGFTCFCFVFVGAPLAMIARTSDYWSTFGLCFLPTLLTYYPLFMLGLKQAKNGVMPPYSVWIGNVLLVGIGTILIARVRRY